MCIGTGIYVDVEVLNISVLQDRLLRLSRKELDDLHPDGEYEHIKHVLLDQI